MSPPNWNFFVSANEPWPDDVKIFQPLETEQILLPDNASCLSVQAFLKMCNLKYEVIQKNNAEDMSPSGELRLKLTSENLYAISSIVRLNL